MMNLTTMSLSCLTNNTQFSLIAFQLLVPKHSVTEPFAANSYILKVRVLMKSGSGVVQMGPRQRWGTPAGGGRKQGVHHEKHFFHRVLFYAKCPGANNGRLPGHATSHTALGHDRCFDQQTYNYYFLFSRGNTFKGVKVTVLMLRLKWDMTGIN